MATDIIRVKQLKKVFPHAEHQELLVLDHVDFSLKEGEIVGLLGKSGSGKSTLLRIIAGLIPPSSGTVYYRDQIVNQPVKGISMVFQNFALMPWLTVLQNVELGLEALGVSRQRRRKRALKAIDTIGLDGFESAYPKELSGGMRQRVGFARALVVEPDFLLMDEPFSALDVLTAENLRSDLLDLWQDGQTLMKGILLVTHSIEEAVMLCDRIIIFDSDPGCIRAELAVELTHPRNPQQNDFRKLVAEIYTIMTTSQEAMLKPEILQAAHQDIEIDYRLPDVEISELTGMLESIDQIKTKGPVNLPELADSLHLDVDDLFPLLDMLDILRFVRVSKAAVGLTPSGKALAKADILQNKEIFSDHLIKHVPLAQYIRQALDAQPGNRLSEQRVIDELANYFSEDEAERVFKTIVDWGRYAEIFAYNYDTGMLSLENPD